MADRNGIVDALQPQQPMQPMSPPRYAGSNGSGMATGPGYAPMTSNFGPPQQAVAETASASPFAFPWMRGNGARPHGQWNAGYQPRPGGEVFMNGYRPMGLMSNPGMWGGGGGWGARIGQAPAQPDFGGIY